MNSFPGTGISTSGSILELLGYLAPMTPFLFFLWRNSRANLKKEFRSRQFAMPILALIYCTVLLVCMTRITEQIQDFLNSLPNFLDSLKEKLTLDLSSMVQLDPSLAESFSDKLKLSFGDKFGEWAQKLRDYLLSGRVFYLVFVIENTIFMMAHILAKRILLPIMKWIFQEGNPIYEFCAQIAYESSPEEGVWCIKPHLGQMRNMFRALYRGAILVSMILVAVSCKLYMKDLLNVPFSPVFGLILLGEVYFFLSGPTAAEREDLVKGEVEDTTHVSNLQALRPILRKLFGDKLNSDDTTINIGELGAKTTKEVIEELKNDEHPMIEAYGIFMERKVKQGLKLDQNYLHSGLDLLKQKSILFNDPFYYDLIPYAFFALNRSLLKGQKGLIVLGRHGAEEDIEKWCAEGLYEVTNVPDMWKIGVLKNEPETFDIGIITRSNVHNLSLHEANAEFFGSVGFVILIEPSRLLTTAQIGLNSIVRYCKRGNKQLTFCSTDKNCDGLVDALSHVLLTSLTEVSATNHHRGVSSYMCWESDNDRLQHRMLPNISRYLGIGTELSFVALKNQVDGTDWYGGEAFPVTDIHWITKQYYYDLLTYAQLPASQDEMDDMFRVTPNIWSAKTRENAYMTVEDEANNMFEIKRLFATRGDKQGFINVISTEYLLKDYMTANDALFITDAKAIPYIVADYAHTLRNVVLRICLRMSSGYVAEEEVKNELLLVDVDTEEVRENLWREICNCFMGKGKHEVNRYGEDVIVHTVGKKTYNFNADIIQVRRKFSLETGKMDNVFSITDERFIKEFLGDLKSANYIAEDEKGDTNFLGSEIMGQVFQKYLPGQFFTFCGKYYEMVRVTMDGQVLVRRAADHINGRPGYRQVRHYFLSEVRDSETMGEVREIGGMKVSTQYANIRVETPAYWLMNKHNDFATGKLVNINAVPERKYYNKQILKVEFPEGSASPEVLHTVTVLFNEILATLFAENQPYISVVTAEENTFPNTYTVEGDEGFTLEPGALYIIEDSQLDIGLLVAVRRNLDRIFSIMCDYLDWHLEALEESINPPAPPADGGAGNDGEDGAGMFGGETAGKKKGWLRRLIEKIKNFFGKFKRKKKDKPEEEGTPVIAGQPVPGEEPSGEPEGTKAPEGETETPKTPEEPETAETAETEETPESGEATESEEPASGEEISEAAEPEAPETDTEILKTPEVSETEETPEDGEEEAKSSESIALFSVPHSGGSSRLNAARPIVRASEEEIPAEGEGTEGEIEFEKPEVIDVNAAMIPERKPYHLRYFLLYGGDAMPEGLNPAETLEFLKLLGFDNGGLKQARKGKGIADAIESSFIPNQAGRHYCDFCGVELTGKEMEVLKDGRERCMVCGRTAIKSEKEFTELYAEVLKNMDTFYGVKITVPVSVHMVNAKKLHKRLKKTFVPTGNPDGRVLGVAIQEGKKYSIYIENGAPRMQSIMTLAHESTHIWQYLNWNRSGISKRYGKDSELFVYEGMAKWAEIQYAYLTNEFASAKREEIITKMREDEYGIGFRKYIEKYPLTEGTELRGNTPFMDLDKPL